MDELNKNEIIKREKEKYNLLHKNIKYGGRTGRAKQFYRTDDDFHKLMKVILSQSKTLLDVGCGKGFFIDVFSKWYKNLSITGCDISEVASKQRPDLKIVVCDAANMPFKDNQFDVVVHMDGMEHIPREIEIDVMNEMVRVAKHYVYMTIATHEVKHHDDKFKEMGLGAVHINMRNPIEWEIFIRDYCLTNKLTCVDVIDYKLWTHALIKI